MGDYFEQFINQQIHTGKFSSASEVIIAALQLFEQDELKKSKLNNELEKGEKSGFAKNFNRSTFLKSLHLNHLNYML